MPTTGSGKWPYPNSSAVPDVPADILLLAQRIDLMSSGWTITANATTRAALVTNSNAYEGLRVYQVDTKVTYIYQSSAWVPLSGSVTPTSVAGAGVTLAGTTVAASGAASASVNGCFTTTFDWYDVSFDLTTSGAAYIQLVLRLSGTDAVTAYDRQATVGENATATTGQTLSQAFWRVTTTTLAGRHSGTVRLFLPAAAVQTTGTVISVGAANPMTSTTGSNYFAGLSHRTTTAYDGLTFTPSTGTITGTIRIQGIA